MSGRIETDTMIYWNSGGAKHSSPYARMFADLTTDRQTDGFPRLGTMKTGTERGVGGTRDGRSGSGNGAHGKKCQGQTRGGRI